MCNVTVSYFNINYKFQREKRQSRSERADQSILDYADQIMIRAIIVERIIDGARR